MRNSVNEEDRKGVTEIRTDIELRNHLFQMLNKVITFKVKSVEATGPSRQARYKIN